MFRNCLAHKTTHAELIRLIALQLELTEANHSPYRSRQVHRDALLNLLAVKFLERPASSGVASQFGSIGGGAGSQNGENVNWSQRAPGGGQGDESLS